MRRLVWLCDACSSLQSETARFPQENCSILYIRLIMRHNLATEGGVLQLGFAARFGALLTPPKLHVGRRLALNRQLSRLSRLPSRQIGQVRFYLLQQSRNQLGLHVSIQIRDMQTHAAFAAQLFSKLAPQRSSMFGLHHKYDGCPRNVIRRYADVCVGCEPCGVNFYVWPPSEICSAVGLRSRFLEQINNARCTVACGPRWSLTRGQLQAKACDFFLG